MTDVGRCPECYVYGSIHRPSCVRGFRIKAGLPVADVADPVQQARSQAIDDCIKVAKEYFDVRDPAQVEMAKVIASRLEALKASGEKK